MADFTPQEQLMLELINRARMNPDAEAKRYGIALNEGPPSTPISSAGKQALAGNDSLALSADKHTTWLLANDLLSHDETPNSPNFYAFSAFDRMAKAGFTGYSTAGENIAYGSAGSATQSVLDLHRLLFVDANIGGRGHRTNILKQDYTEIGIGHQTGQWTQNSSTYNVGVVTTDFGAHAGVHYITGVVYNDTKKNDNFFTVGEQQAASIGVEGSSASDTAGAGGGYELAFTSSGTKTINFELGAADLVVDVKFGGRNVKLDVVNGKEIWTDASSLTSLSTDIKQLHALGIGKVTLKGSDADEKIYGNSAANKLAGNGGKDAISGGDGKDTITGGAGNDTMTGGDGNDKFVFKASSDSTASKADVIKDFGKSGNDKIDLHALGDLTYRDELAITGSHQVNVTKSGSDVIVHINLNADLADEMRIVLDHTTLSSMTSADFIV